MTLPDWLVREERQLLARMERELDGPEPTPTDDVPWVHEFERTRYQLGVAA